MFRSNAQIGPILLFSFNVSYTHDPIYFSVNRLSYRLLEDSGKSHENGSPRSKIATKSQSNRFTRIIHHHPIITPHPPSRFRHQTR